MSNSISYISYLASSEENPQHRAHLYEQQTLCTIIAREQIELYLPQIEKMVNNAVSNAMNSAFRNINQALSVDVNRIVDITVKDLNKQFHSEEVSHFIADTLKTQLEDALSKMDLTLIIK